MNTETYLLDIKIPNNEPQQIELEGTITVGSAEAADISIDGYGLSPKHCNFRVQGGVLSIHNFCADDKSILDGQHLQQGKMYILDDGDVLKLGEIEFAITVKEALPAAAEEEAPVEETAEPVAQEYDSEEIVIVDDEPETKAETETDRFAGNANLSASPEGVEDMDVRDNTEADTETEAETEAEAEPQEEEPERVTSLIQMAKLQEEEESDEMTGTDQEFELEPIDWDEEKTSPGQKLLNLLKRNKSESPEDRLKKMQQAADQTLWFQSPGPIIRIYALIANLAVAYSIIYYFLPNFLEINPQLTLIPSIGMIPQLDFLVPFDPLFQFYVKFIFIDIITNLIFGVSIPMLLLGVQTSGTFLSRRFKAVFRSVIGSITLPLIIFDLPILFKKASAKEFLTKARLTYSLQILKYPALLIFFPAIIVSSLLSPEVFLPGLEHSVTTTPKAKAKKAKEFEHFLNTSSNYWGVEIQTTMPSNIKFFPSIGKVKNIDHSIIFINMKKERTPILSLTRMHKFDLQKILSPLPSGNPLFAMMYPSTNQMLSVKEKFVPNIQTETELKEIFKNIFSLSPQNLPNTIMEYGPFIGSLYQARKKIEKALGIITPATFQFVTFKNRSFLRVITSPAPKYKVDYYIPLSQEYKFSLKTKYAKQATALSLIVEKQILASMLPLKQKNDTLPPIDAFSFVDYFSKLQKSEEIQPIFQEINTYYNELLDEANQSENKGFTRLVNKSYKKVTSWMQSDKEFTRKMKTPVEQTNEE